MTDPKTRFTQTLSQPRVKEIVSHRPGQLVLRVENGGTRQVELRGPRVTGGASPDNDLVLSDGEVSSVHFELIVGDGGATLRDLDSKNGTWVGPGFRVRETWLQCGKSFSVGSCQVTLVEVGAVDVPISTEGQFADLRGHGTKMGELFARLKRLAAIRIDVLIVGETGTGKELVAKGLHSESGRKGPLVVVDCTTLTEGIAESILFGHRAGAFTGATTDRPGLLEEADGGTLFFDEIGELPMSLQPKLLRALGQRETRRVGDTFSRPFDARIVAATNRNLLAMVGRGDFREDLYFRLAEVTLDVPPLRDRGKVDIQALADFFGEDLAEERGSAPRLAREVYEVLSSYSWPGNVRELKSVIRYAGLLSEGEEVTVRDLPPLKSSPASGSATAQMHELEGALLLPLVEARLSFERRYVTRVLSETGGNVSEAARRSGMSRSAFRELLKRVGCGGGPNTASPLVSSSALTR